MKKVTLVLFFSILFSLAAFSQSNEFVDKLINSKAISLGQAAYLVLVASDNLADDSDEIRAFDLLVQQGMVSSSDNSERSISMAEYAFILAKSFGVKGGIMFTFFPSPRYAYRELVARLVIQGKSDPMMTVSGERAIRMLGRVFDIKGVSE